MNMNMSMNTNMSVTIQNHFAVRMLCAQPRPRMSH